MKHFPAEAPALPEDPALPGVSWLRREQAPGHVLQLVKHRPGKRMVVYDGSPPATYWKLFHNDRGEKLPGRHEALERLWREDLVSFRSAEVRGYWPEARALALARLDGIPLPALRSDELPDTMVDAARALASLHDSTFDPGREWTLSRECDLLEQAASIMKMAASEESGPVESLRERIVSAIGAADSPRRPLHRDFHPGQILISRDHGLAILDWDDAALGPAHIDTGNFVAHLRLEGFRRPAERFRWRMAESHFRTEYALRRGRQSVVGLNVYIAAALFRLAGIAIDRHAAPAEAEWLLDEAESSIRDSSDR